MNMHVKYILEGHLNMRRDSLKKNLHDRTENVEMEIEFARILQIDK